MGHKYLRPVHQPPKEEILPLEFPEHKYPAITNKEEYKKRIELGTKRVEKSTLALIGCARDIAPVINRTIYTWERIGSLFRDYKIVIFESDSVDSTLEDLQNWSIKNHKVTILSEKLNFIRRSDLSKQRMEVMATIRNKVRQYTVDNLSWCDYVCVADADLRGPTSIDGILNSFGYAELWDAVFSNGLDYIEKYMYDVAVLTFTGFEDSDIMVEQKSNMPYANFKPGYTRPSYDRGSPLVPVMSAFGGMGFYTIDAFLCGSYASYPVDHISFNKSIHEKGFNRKYINPSQLLIR